MVWYSETFVSTNWSLNVNDDEEKIGNLPSKIKRRKPIWYMDQVSLKIPVVCFETLNSLELPREFLLNLKLLGEQGLQHSWVEPIVHGKGKG